LDSNILVAQRTAGCADAVYNLFDDCLIDEIVQPRLVRVLKFEFVIVGEKTEEYERLEVLVAVLGFLNELGLKLELMARQITGCVGVRKHTFMRAGKRSR